jgi:hypothetical protein
VLARSFALLVSCSVVACSSDEDTSAPRSPPPIAASARAWEFVEFPESRCRDGSSAGIFVNGAPSSQRLMIFLQGGGACFNAAMCGINPARVERADLGFATGILDRGQPDNPVADWNLVFVPYCTGDVHAGDHVGGDPGIGPQHFVGYRNLELFLDRLVPTFPQLTHVLFAGASAGGYATGLTADLPLRKFASSTRVVVLDDSGPGMSSTYIAKCLQRRWRTLFGYDRTILADCGRDCPDPDAYAQDIARHVMKNPRLSGGLLSSIDDALNPIIFGYGVDDCTADPARIAAPLPAGQYRQGLLEFRELARANGTSFGTYYVPGEAHTFTQDPGFSTVEVGGVRLVDWVSRLIDAAPAQHVGP